MEKLKPAWYIVSSNIVRSLFYFITVAVIKQ